MKTAINISNKLLEQAEFTARELGISPIELFSRAIEEFIKKNNPKSITEKLDEVYSQESSSLDDTTMNLQLKSIEKEEW